jgi:hypothetical protein
MPTIAVYPSHGSRTDDSYEAVAGTVRASGATVGEAIDRVRAQLPDGQDAALIMVQSEKPDDLFPETKIRRLKDLMARWHSARDSGVPFAEPDQTELTALIREEQAAVVTRSGRLLRSAR